LICQNIAVSSHGFNIPFETEVSFVISFFIKFSEIGLLKTYS